MNELKCLSEQELSEFVRGRIDDLRVEQIAEHLEACGDCQATVVMLGERSDTFVEQLRAPAVSDALETENACQAGVERLAAQATDGRSGSSRMAPDVGEIEQLGPYRIQRQLGVGGMGTVHEAIHTKLKRTVALKILPASRWTNSLAIARFEREMEIIGQLDHPNIVRASDAGEENDMHYLVMEHVDGLDLSRVVNRVGPLAIADACEIARQAAMGLQYAHENHLVHRDIKPSNLMLSAGGRARRGDQRVSTADTRPSTTIVKILDLGLALLGESHAAHENELTTVGQLMGTLDYMSPEQGMDSHEVDIRADIYSLGATLFKLLTGRAPFAAPQYDTLLKKVTALANKPVTPIQQLRADIPDELASIIDRMLSKEPADRFNTPHEVANALQPFTRSADLSGLLAAALIVEEREPMSLPPVIASRNVTPPPARAAKAPPMMNDNRHWILAGLLVILGLFAFAAGIVILIKTDKGELVVRAEDDAQVIVRRDGTTVEQLEVAKGDHSVTVRSGAYQIQLKGASDELMMSRDTVIIKRGERVIVHVLRRPKANAGMEMEMMMDMSESMSGMGPGTSGIDVEEGSGGHAAGRRSGEAAAGTMAMEDGADEGSGSRDSYPGSGFSGGFGGDSMYDTSAVPAQPNPTYDGKTYTQWLAEMQSERKPERLTEAIRAFASLGEDDQELATRSATVIMQVMRRNGAFSGDDSPQGKLIQQSQNVLQQMPGEIVVAAIEEELREGNARSRSFAILLLRAAFYGYGSPNVDFVSTVNRHREPIYQLLLTLPDDEAGTIRAAALSLVIDHATAKNTALDQVEGLTARLHDTLKEQDLTLVAIGSEALVGLEPDNKDLVPALVRLMASEDYEQRTKAVSLLGRLGARSHAAVDHLVAIIQPIAEPNSKSSADAAAQANFVGVMGGFGGGSFGDMYGAGGYGAPVDIYYVAIDALGNVGPAAKKALPVLRKIAEHKPPAEHSAAAGTADDYAGGGGSEMMGGGFGTNYVAVAKAAINKIEEKEVYPPTPAADGASAPGVGSGGIF